MIVTLGLVRHGRASGQGPEADLLPEGALYVARLGSRLMREGWSPAAALSSPYLRATETLRILLGELASDLEPRRLIELTPDSNPDRALTALIGLGLPAGRVLVVAHMPLLGRLVDELTEELVDFYPGTFVELQLDGSARRGQLVRTIGPESL
jgi:phosphohistidine phosphatase SixA